MFATTRSCELAQGTTRVVPCRELVPNINMKEKFKLYFVFYGHKLCKVNLINAIVCKKSSFKVDIRQNKKICYLRGQWINLTGYIDSPYMG